jgi:hypothetical protein
MDPFYLESELIKPVSDYFKKQGYKVRREVRIGFCRADLVVFKNDKSTAVELKLSDRKKAIIQAKNYQLGVDYVYLAFPLLKSYSLLRKSEHILKREGIGLLTINEETCDVREIIGAKISNKKFSSVKLEEIDRRRKNRKSKYRMY